MCACRNYRNLWVRAKRGRQWRRRIHYCQACVLTHFSQPPQKLGNAGHFPMGWTIIGPATLEYLHSSVVGNTAWDDCGEELVAKTALLLSWYRVSSVSVRAYSFCAVIDHFRCVLAYFRFTNLIVNRTLVQKNRLTIQLKFYRINAAYAKLISKNYTPLVVDHYIN